MNPIRSTVLPRLPTICKLLTRSSSKFPTRRSEIGPMEEYKEQLKPENPIKRTGKIIKNDMRLLGHQIRKLAGFEEELSEDLKYQQFATHTDILVVGGGAYATAIAFWLKKRAPYGLNVTVIDNQENVPKIPWANLHQQFETPENVMMSVFGAEFLRSIDEHCSEVSPLDVEFCPNGFLFLRNDAEDAKYQCEVQNKLGARNILLSREEITKRFPRLSTSGVQIGCLGVENEGSFNHLALHENLRRKSINFGAEYVSGDVLGFEFMHQPHIIAPNKGKPYEQLERIVLKLPNDQVHAIKFGLCIIADDVNSSKIADFARIGHGDGLLSVSLEMEQSTRTIFCFESPELFGVTIPTVVTTNGVTFRIDGMLGQLFVTSEENQGIEREISQWLNVNNLTLREEFEEHYEGNALDECGVLGPHPYYHNLHIASGFSRHGPQHAPAVGRAIMELILDGEYKTMNLSRLGFDRLCLGEPIESKLSL